MRPVLVILAVLSSLVQSRLAAQEREPAEPMQRVDTARAISEADISITASVTARELTFETTGESSVSFRGTMNRDTIHIAERINLPPLIRASVTYRDIGVRLVIVSAFADIDTIVAEALGEVPSDGAREEGPRRDTKGGE